LTPSFYPILTAGLQQLRLMNLPLMALPHTLASATRLTSLELTCCKHMRIDSRAAQAMLLRLTRLQRLDLKGTPTSPAAAACLARCIPGLELTVED